MVIFADRLSAGLSSKSSQRNPEHAGSNWLWMFSPSPPWAWVLVWLVLFLCMSHHSILYLRYENANMSVKSCRGSSRVHVHWMEWKLSEAVCYSEELLRGVRSQADVFPEACFRRPEWSTNMGMLKMCVYQTGDYF